MKPKPQTLHIAGRPVAVTRKRIKHIYLYVKPSTGRVSVSAPLGASDALVRRFVEAKGGWIQAQLQKAQAAPRPQERALADGETLPVWGQPYRLQVRTGPRYALALDGDTARLTVRAGSTREQRERFVREWYREQLKHKAAVLLPRWEGITGLHAAGGFQTKWMKTRWGTCNIKAKKLWLNVRLAEKPVDCLEYVILHELIHLLERGHNARFYALVERFMPGWKQMRAKLREIPVDNANENG